MIHSAQYHLKVDYIYDWQKKQRYQTTVRVHYFHTRYIWAWLSGMLIWMFESTDKNLVRFNITRM